MSLRWGIYFLISILMLLLVSPFTSLLSPYYMDDPAIFSVVGRGIAHGMVPYRDLFDHKGPLLFYINGLGYFIHDGKAGVFLLSAIFMTVNLWLVHRTSSILAGPRLCFIPLTLFVVIYICMGETSNTSEEWSLPFTLAPLYLVIRNYASKKESSALPFGLWFIIGICIGAHMMLRPNNAAMLCGLACGLAIIDFAKCGFPAVISRIAVLMAGSMVLILPFVVFFFAIDALQDFMYANFIFNYKYVQNGADMWTIKRFLATFAKVCSCPFAIFLLWRLTVKKEISRALALSIALGGIISSLNMFIGRGYAHYYICYLPFAVVAASVMIKYLCLLNLKWKATASALLVFVLFFPYFRALPSRIMNARDCYIKNAHDSDMAAVQEIASCIPANEKDQVWAYNVNPYFYLYSGILPCYKFFVLQPFHAKADSAINQGIDQMLKDSPPLWVAIPEGCHVSSGGLSEALAGQYELVRVSSVKPKTSPRIRLYRLKKNRG